MVVPIPTAGPPTAATIGLRSSCMATKKRADGEPSTSGGRLRKSPTSLPAQKQSGAPCSRTTRTCASLSAPAIASASCPYISPVRAFFLSRRASSTKAMRFSVLARIKLEVLELLAQGQLGELAGRRMRQLGDEQHVVGHPPLGDLAFVELEQLGLGDLGAGLLHHDHDRPLVPFRVLDADHRRLGDGRVGDGDVLQVDGADVAGREPAVVQGIAALALEVAPDYPGTAHLEVAERLAVPRQLVAVLVDDAHVD